MTVATKLNKMEKVYFFRRQTGQATADGYIASNTWRAFPSVPRKKDAPSQALRAAYDVFTRRLERLIGQRPDLTRNEFDRFHAKEVTALYEFLRSFHEDAVVEAAALGDFHGRAYNPYAKVLNLAYSHYCFLALHAGQPRFPPSKYPQLRACLHVPLDTNVLEGVNRLIGSGLLPRFRIPVGSMGSIRTQREYGRIQDYLRSEADKIASKNFHRSKVSPLAFEAFW